MKKVEKLCTTEVFDRLCMRFKFVKFYFKKKLYTVYCKFNDAVTYCNSRYNILEWMASPS